MGIVPVINPIVGKWTSPALRHGVITPPVGAGIRSECPLANDRLSSSRWSMNDANSPLSSAARRPLGLRGARTRNATKLFRAMSSISAARIAGHLAAYDFSQIAKLVDVGGAHGAMTLAIAKRYPSIRCTCFDLPTAELGAIRTLRDKRALGSMRFRRR